ncbi:hypothetical protein QBC42DRAFT_73277 [Cladorrhinum samala]|uniref:BZIP domain-containing protein n=1 Tax=Cladorrhinum samala TaxID=585594 RepID=A0AAV9HQG2_9PEZI|nr:hypothetical protein QBC42DRAFT_73277 [Cladorrhinum samala]
MEDPTPRFYTAIAAPSPSREALKCLEARHLQHPNTPTQPDTSDDLAIAAINRVSTLQSGPVFPPTPGTAYFGALDITSFVPPEQSQQEPSIAFTSNYSCWQPAISSAHDAATHTIFHPAMVSNPSAQHPILSQDPNLLTPVMCDFPPGASGSAQISGPDWYGAQTPGDEGSYGNEGYSDHAVYPDSTASAFSNFNVKRRATIDASYLHSECIPNHPSSSLESEPASESSYFALSPYSQIPQARSPQPPSYPAQYTLVDEPHPIDQGRYGQRVGVDISRRKRGRPPTRLDRTGPRRASTTDSTAVSPLSSSNRSVSSLSPSSDGVAFSSTAGGRATLQARNRAAANRYRAKTQAAVAQLEAEERCLTLKRQSLLLCAGELRDQVFQLKNEVFRHASCGCPRIEGYLENAAQRAYARQSLATLPQLEMEGSPSTTSSSPSKAD